TGRHFDGESLVLLHGATTMAHVAGILDGLARTVTARAGLLYRERPLTHAHLTHTTTGDAVFGRAAAAGACAIAGGTGDAGRNADLDGGTADGVFEGEFERVAEIGTSLHVAATTSAEDVTENVAEDVTETSVTTTHVTIHAGVAELVIGRALVGIG